MGGVRVAEGQGPGSLGVIFALSLKGRHEGIYSLRNCFPAMLQKFPIVLYLPEIRVYRD